MTLYQTTDWVFGWPDVETFERRGEENCHFTNMEVGEIYRFCGMMIDAYSVTKGFSYDDNIVGTRALANQDLIVYLGTRVDGLYIWVGFWNLTGVTRQWVQADWLRYERFEKIS